MSSVQFNALMEVLWMIAVEGALITGCVIFVVIVKPIPGLPDRVERH
jgi:hypothetical protein